jgi:hypothetical protein
MKGRKLLYFLGAGASRGAGVVAHVQGGGGVPIPLQADFWRTVLRFASKSHRKQIEAFLFRYFAGYRRVPARTSGIKRTELLSGIDTEEVFTFLSERSRAPSTSPQLKAHVDRVWASLVASVGSAFQRFEPNATSRRIYKALIKHQLRSRDAVVSFNYDTVFERSLPSGYAWHYPSVSDERRGLRVLKPHGSVKWVLDCGKIIRRDDAPTVPVLVAPTHLKFVRGDGNVDARRDARQSTDANDTSSLGYLDLFPQIQEIWASMEKQMYSAKALIFIGYSFPVADLYFSSVLRSVLASRTSRPKVVLVNPDAVAIGARIQDRFRLSKPLLFFGIEQFVEMSRARLMRDLGL